MTEPERFFADYFPRLADGRSPYPWQARLFRNIAAGRWPDSLALPTGSGKTAILQVWLISPAWSLRHGQREAILRRLVWVVNRRVVVDQATEEAEGVQRRIAELPADDPLAAALSDCSAPGTRLSVSTLRGKHADNRERSRGYGLRPQGS
ncbi:MAG: hypothetical protein ABSF98_12305 [Bryobacteraceae bacterium]